MDVSQCINMLGPGLDAPKEEPGRPTEVRPGEHGQPVGAGALYIRRQVKQDTEFVLMAS